MNYHRLTNSTSQQVNMLDGDGPQTYQNPTVTQTDEDLNTDDIAGSIGNEA